MMTNQVKPKYEWPNKLSFDDRACVVRYYLQGYGLFHIAETYGVSTTTIEYHLKKAQVFIPNKKPTLFGNVNPIQKKAPVVKRTLAVIAPSDNRDYYFDEFGERYRRPLTYTQIMRRQANIQRLKKAIADRQPKQEEQKSTGFLVRVSLTTGNTIVRTQDGRYEITQAGTEPPKYYTSSNTYSY